jgi:hypothetical protein
MQLCTTHYREERTLTPSGVGTAGVQVVVPAGSSSGSSSAAVVIRTR